MCGLQSYNDVLSGAPDRLGLMHMTQMGRSDRTPDRWEKERAEMESNTRPPHYAWKLFLEHVPVVDVDIFLW